MAKLIGGSGYDDVQSTQPSNPSIGDTWLDTSTDPPTGKIYADLGGGGQWTIDSADDKIDRVFSSLGSGVTESIGTQSEFKDWEREGFTPPSDRVGGAAEVGINSTGSEGYTGSSTGDPWSAFIDTDGFSAGGEISVVTSNTVDLTGYSKLVINWDRSDGNGAAALTVLNNKTDSRSNAEAITSQGGTFSNETNELDVSRITSNKYIAVHAYTGGTNGNVKRSNFTANSITFLSMPLVTGDEIFDFGPDGTGETVVSPLITDPKRTSYNSLAFNTVENGSVDITLDLVDSSDTVVKSDVKSGADLGGVDPSKAVKIRANFSRTDTADDGALKSASLRWSQ